MGSGNETKTLSEDCTWCTPSFKPFPQDVGDFVVYDISIALCFKNSDPFLESELGHVMRFHPTPFFN